MGLFTHLRQKQLEAADAAVTRHNGNLAAYLERVACGAGNEPGERRVTVLARSPVSPVARALVDNAEMLKTHGVMVQGILAQIEPQPALRELVETVASLSPGRPLGELVRWANRSSVHDAHEQLILGRTMCWSGDMMRREPGKRDGLDLFEIEAPQTVRLGALAFSAIWSITAPVPASRLRGETGAQGGSYAPELGADLPRAAFLKPGEPPPLLRH